MDLKDNIKSVDLALTSVMATEGFSRLPNQDIITFKDVLSEWGKFKARALKPEIKKNEK